MRTLFYLLFALLLTTKTGLCQNGDEYNDYNNDEDDYNNGEEEEDMDMPDKPQPNIMSRPQQLETIPGSTIELPCKIENAENGLLEWYFGSNRIYMDDVKMIEEPRYIKKDDSLVITNVTEKDAGNYTCMLVNEKQYLSHTLSVNSPVRIINFYTTKDNLTKSDRDHTSHAVWLKGSKQRIFCNATGYPTPSISITHLWMHGKHKSGQLETLVGNPIVIDPVERKHAGKYVCTAKNDLSTIEKTIQVEVEYPPEVHMKKDYIATAVGKETVISCRVQAHPHANVQWMRYNDRLDTVNREMIEDREGANHILKIMKTRENDFGVYTCIAKNSLGSSNKTVRVAGEPSRPVIQSADFDDDLVTPVLTWKIESQVPLMEYKLEYKKQENNNWYDVNKSAEIHESSVDNSFIIKHKFDDLEEGTYHARIKAKNQYGWSENSLEKTFSGNKVLPRTANTYSQLESVRLGSASEMRTSLAFVFSLLAAHLLH